MKEGEVKFVMIIIIVFVAIMGFFYLIQPSQEGYEELPKALAPDDVRIEIVNKSADGTDFQFHLVNAKPYIIHFADTYEFQNPRPAPVRTTAPIDGSVSAAASRVSRSSRIVP